MSVEEIIAELKQLQPDQRVEFLSRRTIAEMVALFGALQPDERVEVLGRAAEEDYLKRQTEYELQEEQQRKLSRKPRNECDDYGMPDYTP
jgi:hypothetical protein